MRMNARIWEKKTVDLPNVNSTKTNPTANVNSTKTMGIMPK